MEEGPAGRPGRGSRSRRKGKFHRASRRNGRSRCRPTLEIRPEIQPSTNRRLERGRAAARESRKDGRTREGRCRPQRPQDFAAHEPLHATALSAKAERRASANRSHCGRRTSIQSSTERRYSLPTVYRTRNRSFSKSQWTEHRKPPGDLPGGLEWVLLHGSLAASATNGG